MAAVSKQIEYYNDEELDRFRGKDASAYSETEIDEFRDILYTMRDDEVAGWGAQPATARRPPARRIERRSIPYYRGKEIRPRMSILSYTFFQNALLGSLFASIACGIIGTYIVTRRLVFISGGITHASFGGVGIGLYTGLSPLLTAAIFSILSAFGVEWLSKRSDMREDSAIAVFWTFGMAVGIIFSFLAPGFTPDLSSFLFGNILLLHRVTSGCWPF